MKQQTGNFNRFDSIVGNYINGNITDYKSQLNKLSKIDLIRFTNFLEAGGYAIRIHADSDNNLYISK